jgi:hypothetical protein
LSITRWRSADHVVDLDVVVFLPSSPSIHRIREFDEDGVFLHDPLDVLPSNADNTFVVLVGDVEGYRGRHFLLHQVQTIFGSIILSTAHIDIKIILVEAVEDDLYVACASLVIMPGQTLLSKITLAHDLVDLPILLPTDKLLVLVGKLNLDANLVIISIDKRYLVDHHHRCFDGIIRAVDSKSEFVKTDICARVYADIREHNADVSC